MTEPTKLKLWRAVRVTQVKVPVTLDDCEEGRLSVVTLSDGVWVIRKRRGSASLAFTDDQYGLADRCKFIRYLDEPQMIAPPSPTTFGELRDGQCFRFSPDHRVMWRAHNECMWVLGSGKIGSKNSSSDEPITFIPDIEMVLEEQPC